MRATLAAAVLTGAMVLPQVVDAASVDIYRGSVGTDSITDSDTKEAVALNPGKITKTNDAYSQADRAGYKSVAIGTMALADNQSVAVGYESEAKGQGSITMGTGAIVTGWNGAKYNNDSTWAGYIKENAQEHTGAAIEKSIVIGAGSFISPNPFGLAGGADSFYDSGQGVVLGTSSVGTSQATALGNNVYAVGRSSIALGSDDTAAYRDVITQYDYDKYFKKIYNSIDPYGHIYGYLKDGVTAVTTDSDPNSYRPSNRIYSPTLAQGHGSIAIGSRSLANADGATALGTLAFALQKGSTAIGTVTRAEGEGALAFGNNTYVFANNAIGVGSRSQVLNTGGTAYGYKTYSAGNNAIAIGRDVYANVAMTAQKDGNANVFTDTGKYNFDPTKGARSILDGVSIADLSMTGMLVSGDTDGSITYDKALEKLVAKNAASDSTVGLGFLTANTAEKNGVANVVTTSGENAIVIGSRSVATGNSGISLGRGAISLADNSFALGSYSMSTSKNSIALGLASRTTGNNSLAIGTASSTLGNNSLSVGAGTINYGTDTTVVGTRSGVIDNVKDSVVLGSRGIIGKGIQNSLAIGTNASVGNYLINDEDLIVRLDPTTGNLPINPTTRKPYTAEEYRALIASKGYTEATKITGIEANRSFILANADGNGNGLVNAIAIGNDARVFSKATGTNLYTTSTERGVYEGKVLATEDGRNAMAIGNGAQAWLENSLALGVNSKTDYTPKQLAAEAWRTPDAIAVSTTSNVGVISVGSLGGERRIVNLAAGAYDTDAVNVSQLKQMYDTIQRQVNGGDDLQGLHYLSTKSGIIASGETDYVMKNNAQVAYRRYVNTLKEYKSYLLKEAFGGAQLTEEAKKGYNDELTKLEARLVENGVSRETLDNNLKIRTYTKSDPNRTVVTTDTITRDPITHAITGVTVNKAAMGDNVTVTDAINALEGNLETDLGVLANNNNAITGLTSATIEQGLNSINYNNSLATGKGSVAIGYKTAASSDYSTAIGAEALASGATDAGLGATAVGAKSKATAKNTLAVGQGATATRENALAIGVSANVKGGSMAVGNWTEIPNAGSTNSVAVGQGAKLYGDVDESVTVGAYSRIGDEASTSTRTITGATSVGSNSVVAGDGGTAIGHRTNIALTASNATALGKEATVAKANSVAIGYKSAVLSSDDGSSQGRFYGDVPTTAGVTAPTLGVVSFGNGSDTRRLIHVAAGIDDTDAVNVAQLQSLANQKISFYTDKGESKGIQAPLGKLSTTRGNNDTYEGPGFYLVGGAAGDIKTTSTAGAGELLPKITFDLNKADAVTAGETKAVTGDAVYKAIEAAKDEVTAAKTTVKAKAGTPITVEPATTGAAEYTVGFDADAAEAATKLTYQAGTSGTNEVALSTGLNFQEGTAGTVAIDNLELTSAAGGAVNIGLKKDLTNLTSVGGASGAGKFTFNDGNTISANGARLTNLANGSDPTDAATVGQVGELAKKATQLTLKTVDTTSQTLKFKTVTTTPEQGILLTEKGNISDRGNLKIDVQDSVAVDGDPTKTQKGFSVALNTDLKGITSITNNKGTAATGTSLTLSDTGLALNNKPITGLTASADNTSAVTLQQLKDSRVVVEGTNGASVTSAEATDEKGKYTKYTVSLDTATLGAANDKVFARIDGKNLSTMTGTGKTNWRTALDVFSKSEVTNITDPLATRVSTLETNKIGITGATTGENVSNAKSLKDGNISFSIKDANQTPDINTVTTNEGVTLSLDKSGTVTDGNSKVVTGGTVYSAVSAARTTVAAANDTTNGSAGKGIITVSGGDQDGVNAKAYTLGVNIDNLKEALNIDKNATGTFTDKITYKSKNGSVTGTEQKVALTEGLVFEGDTNITTTAGAAGNVQVALNSTLKNLTAVQGDTGTAGLKFAANEIHLTDATGTDVTNGVKLTGIAEGKNTLDAVNFKQLSEVKDSVTTNTTNITNLTNNYNSLTARKIALQADDTKKVEKELSADVTFGIKGASDDITTAINGDNLTIGVKKATAIAENSTQLATAGQVYTAVTGAKTKVVVSDTNNILSFASDVKEGVAADTYTLGINKSNLVTALNDSFAKKDATNIDATTDVPKWKEKLGYVTAGDVTTQLNSYTYNKAGIDEKVANATTTVAVATDSQAYLTATDAAGTTAHDYTLSLKTDKLSESLQIGYKAGSESTTRNVVLSKGLTFQSKDSNLTASSEADGVVKYGLNSTLSNITSIGGSGTTLTFGSGTATFNNTQLKGLANGDLDTDAATVGQMKEAKQAGTDAKTAVDTLGKNKIKLLGTEHNTLDNGQALNKAGGLSFTIAGDNGDIVTDTVSAGVSIRLNKAATIDNTTNKDRVVTAGQVFNAIVNAKPTITGDGVIGVDPNKGTDLTAPTYSLSLDTAKLKEKLGIDPKAGTLSGEIAYRVVNGTTVGTKSATGLAAGFEFTGSDNITTATITPQESAAAAIQFSLAKDLKGITSIAEKADGTGAKIVLKTVQEKNADVPTVSIENSKLTNVLAGTNDTDAVNYKQLKDVAARIGDSTNTTGSGPAGPAGKDGLDGKNGTPPQSLTDKVLALRSGTAGNMVYTITSQKEVPNGQDGTKTVDYQERLVYEAGQFYKASDVNNTDYVKAADGLWYAKADVADNGLPLVDKMKAISFADKVLTSGAQAISDASKINISAVNADGEVIHATPIMNVKSGLGVTDLTVQNPSKEAITNWGKQFVGSIQGKNGLYALSGDALNQAATLGDLKALGTAGLDIQTNGGNLYQTTEEGNLVTKQANRKITASLGDTISLTGGTPYTMTNAGDFDGTNLTTVASENGLSIFLKMKKTPDFTGVNFNNAVTVSAEAGTDDKPNTLTLSKLGTTPNAAGSDVVLRGITDSTERNTAVTRGSFDDLKADLGLNGNDGQAGFGGTDGTNGAVGPAGKDGLDGRSIIDQVASQRQGLSGNMVYTDMAGERLVLIGDQYYKKSAFDGYKLASDGKWYANTADNFDMATGKLLKVPKDAGRELGKLADDLKKADGTVNVTKENVMISTVNPDGTTTNPTVIGNLKSTLSLKQESGVNVAADITSARNLVNGNTKAAAGTDDKAGLLALSGTTLNHAATLGELQAVAKAGIQFTADTTTLDATKVVETPIGGSVAIKGNGYTSDTAASYSATNLATFVDGKSIVVKMKNTPTFEEVTLQNTDGKVQMTPGANSTLTLSNGTSSENNQIELKGLKEGTASDSAVTLAQLNKATAAIGSSGVDGAAGPAGKDGLNGQNMGEQLVALRSGTAGTMVYTIDDGKGAQTRVLTNGTGYYKASDVVAAGYTMLDGKWYKNDQFSDEDHTTLKSDAKATAFSEIAKGLTAISDTKDIGISTVNPDGTVVKVTELRNVASSLKAVSETDSDIVGHVAQNNKEATGLYAVNGDGLNKAATVGDLQAVAKAGISFTGNSKDSAAATTNHTATVALNETLAIKGGIELGSSLAELPTVTARNLYTDVDSTSGTITIKMLATPEFKGVVVGASEDTPNADDKLVSMNTDDAGALVLSNDKAGTDADANRVVLRGLKDGIADDSAVTRKALKDLGVLKGDTGATGVAGVNGENGTDGLAGKDGVSDQSLANQVLAQREGLTGNMVYTDKDGKRLTRVDGHYYKQTDFTTYIQDNDLKQDPVTGKWFATTDFDGDNLKASVDREHTGKTASNIAEALDAAEEATNPVFGAKVNPKEVQINAVSPVSGEPVVPTVVGNIASTVRGIVSPLSNTDADGAADASDAINALKGYTIPAEENGGSAKHVDGLLALNGKVLSNVATVGDLQTVAQAGLTFQTNNLYDPTPGEDSTQDNPTLKNPLGNKQTIHMPLSNTLSIIGKEGATYNSALYTADNLVTTVAGDGKLQVAMSRVPTFDAMTLGDATATFKRFDKGTPDKSDDVGTIYLSFQKDGKQDTGVSDVIVQGLTTGTDPSSAVTKGYVDNLLTGGLVISTPPDPTGSMPSVVDGFSNAGLFSQVLAARNGVSGPVVYTSTDGTRVMRATVLEKDNNGAFKATEPSVIKTSALNTYKLATDKNGQAIGWFSGSEGIWEKVKVAGISEDGSEQITNHLGYSYVAEDSQQGLPTVVTIDDKETLLTYLNKDVNTMPTVTNKEKAEKAFVEKLQQAVLSKDKLQDGDIINGKVVLSLVDTYGDTKDDTTQMVLRHVASDVDFAPATLTGDNDKKAKTDLANAKAFATTLAGVAPDAETLDSAATVGDIRYLAKAGMDFTANAGTVPDGNNPATGKTTHRNIGEALNILGTSKADADWNDFATRNVMTHMDAADTLSIGFSQEPAFNKLTLDNREKDGSLPAGTTEAKVTMTPTKASDTAPTILTLDNGKTGDDLNPDDKAVILDGIKAGEGANTAVNKGQLDELAKLVKGATGNAGVDGLNGIAGPAGRDGLDGKDGLHGTDLSSQVNAQRSGLSGNMVYTIADDKGLKERLIKYNGDYYKQSAVEKAAKDAGYTNVNGSWYTSAQLTDGQPKAGEKGITGEALMASLTNTIGGPAMVTAVKPEDITISAVNVAADDVNKAVRLTNISGSLIDGTGDNAHDKAKTALNTQDTGLLNITSTDKLNTAATIGDLQKVAKAGLDFQGNSQTNQKVDTLAAPLSTTIKIIGKSDTTLDSTTLTDGSTNKFSADNLATKVDDANKSIQVLMKEKPTFKGLTLEAEDGNKVVFTPSDNTLTLGNGKDGKDANDIELKGIAAGNDLNSAVNKKQLDDTFKSVGISAPKGDAGVDGVAGPAGNNGYNGTDGRNGVDGLSGQNITDKLNALRSGTAGNLVYTTTKEGKEQRLTVVGNKYFIAADVDATGYKRAADGKWYEASVVDANGKVTDDNAEAVDVATVQAKLTGKDISIDKINISAVNANGSVNTATPLRNIAGTLYSQTTNVDQATAISAPDAVKAVRGTDAVTGKGGLLAKAGTELNSGATLGDLQAVAQAGLDIQANVGNTKNDGQAKDTIHRPLGTTLQIIGKASAKTTDVDKAKEWTDNYSVDNVMTYADGQALKIGFAKSPIFNSVTIGEGTTKVNLSTDEAGDTLTLSKSPKSTEPDADNRVVLDGLKDGTSPNSAVTKEALDALAKQIGINGQDGNNGQDGTGIPGNGGVHGSDGTGGAAGKDGLDGQTIINKIEAQRNGLSGNMVYTDADGNRLIKNVKDGKETFYKASDVDGYAQANNGQWYEKAQVGPNGEPPMKDGKPVGGVSFNRVLELANAEEVKSTNVIISAVDATGKTKSPIVLGNVKSTIGLDGFKQAVDDDGQPKKDEDGKPIMEANGPIGEAAAKEAVGTNGLLGKKGVDLNRIATVGDLQAVAQAGLDFTGNTKNNDKDFHATLGSTVAIKGGVNYDDTISSDNIATKVTNEGILIGMKKAPTFEGLSLQGKDGKDGKTITLTPSADGKTITVQGPKGTDGKNGEVIIKGITTGDTPDSVATKGYVEKAIDGLNGTNGTNGLNGSNGTNGADGTSTAANGQAGPAGKDGLNGQNLGAQVLAGRDGLSGAMVYTTDAGERLVRDGDKFYTAKSMNDPDNKVKLAKIGGNFYNVYNLGYVPTLNDKGQLVDKDGKPLDSGLVENMKQDPTTVGADKVIISAIDPEKGEATKPTAIGNVKSFIGNDAPNGKAIDASTAKGKMDTLLAAEKANLGRAATVGDLQAVAQAGLDFVADDGNTVHRTLGSTLNIKANKGTWSDYDTTNLMTYANGNTITIGMKKSPVFESIVIGVDPIKGEPGKDGVTLGSDGKGNLTVNDNVVLTGDKNANIFTITDGKGNKQGIKIGDTITFDKYLEVIKGGATTGSDTDNTGTTGNTGSTGTTDNTGSTTTDKSAGTVNVDRDELVKGLVKQSDFEKSIEDINNKINKLDNLDLSKLQPNGTIGTGQESDLQAVSGETVRDYLDKNYTNNAVLNQRLTKLSKQANAGTASALAAAAIPQVTNMYDDNLMIGAGTGVYGGESAVAIGVSGTNDNRDRTYKLSTTYDSTGKWGLSAGIGFSIGSGKNTPKPSAARALSERVDRLEAENKALRETNQTEIKDLAAKNDQLQKQVQELQAMLKQLVPQVQAANAAAKTTDEEAEQPVAPAV